MQMRMTKGEKIFNVFNLIFLGILGLSMLYPFIFSLNLSISDAAGANSGGFFLWPKGFSLAAYEKIFSDPMLVTGYLNTIFRTVVGVVLTVCCTALCAYPLSRPNMPYRKKAMFFVLFTMLFGGGLVPNYLLYNSLGLINNRLIYIIPGLIAAFNVILVRNYFTSISESLHEAAAIDGASEWFIFTRIYFPLSKPILATVAMFTAITHWNSWFDSMLYMTDETKMVVQTFLQRIVIEGNLAVGGDAGMLAQNTDFTEMTPETIKAATVVVTVIPMMILYPFVQKFFTKGIMIGGVKE